MMQFLKMLYTTILCYAVIDALLRNDSALIHLKGIIGLIFFQALVAMNKRKELYALHRGSFSEEGLGPFLNLLTYGRGTSNTYPLPDGKVPEIVAREPWNGEDAPPVSNSDL